jgi:hypothetical protein
MTSKNPIWIPYNTAIVTVLLVLCCFFDQSKYEVITAFSVFLLGASVMYYDWWALKNGKYKQSKINEVY